MSAEKEKLEEMCKLLGIPSRAFVGGEHSHTLSAEFEARERERIESMRGRSAKHFIAPLVEKAMPELFWETAFVMSPNVKVMVRRKDPGMRIRFE